jgi:hypothetical protein
VVLKSTKSAQVPSTSVVPKVLPKQILLYYKIRTKKYAKKIFFWYCTELLGTPRGRLFSTPKGRLFGAPTARLFGAYIV